MKWAWQRRAEELEQKAREDQARQVEINEQWKEVNREVHAARQHRNDNGFIEMLHGMATGKPA